MSTAIHPVMGTCFRISKVLTNLPLVPDKPISFGAKGVLQGPREVRRGVPVGLLLNSKTGTISNLGPME